MIRLSIFASPVFFLAAIVAFSVPANPAQQIPNKQEPKNANPAKKEKPRGPNRKSNPKSKHSENPFSKLPPENVKGQTDPFQVPPSRRNSSDPFDRALSKNVTKPAAGTKAKSSTTKRTPNLRRGSTPIRRKGNQQQARTESEKQAFDSMLKTIFKDAPNAKLIKRWQATIEKEYVNVVKLRLRLDELRGLESEASLERWGNKRLEEKRSQLEKAEATREKAVRELNSLRLQIDRRLQRNREERGYHLAKLRDSLAKIIGEYRERSLGSLSPEQQMQINDLKTSLLKNNCIESELALFVVAKLLEKASADKADFEKSVGNCRLIAKSLTRLEHRDQWLPVKLFETDKLRKREMILEQCRKIGLDLEKGRVEFDHQLSILGNFELGSVQSNSQLRKLAQLSKEHAASLRELEYRAASSTLLPASGRANQDANLQQLLRESGLDFVIQLEIQRQRNVKSAIQDSEKNTQEKNPLKDLKPFKSKNSPPMIGAAPAAKLQEKPPTLPFADRIPKWQASIELEIEETSKLKKTLQSLENRKSKSEKLALAKKKKLEELMNDGDKSWEKLKAARKELASLEKTLQAETDKDLALRISLQVSAGECLRKILAERRKRLLWTLSKLQQRKVQNTLEAFVDYCDSNSKMLEPELVFWAVALILENARDDLKKFDPAALQAKEIAKKLEIKLPSKTWLETEPDIELLEARLEELADCKKRLSEMAETELERKKLSDELKKMKSDSANYQTKMDAEIEKTKRLIRQFQEVRKLGADLIVVPELDRVKRLVLHLELLDQAGFGSVANRLFGDNNNQ